MASTSLDKKTGWWSVRYLSGPAGRAKKNLCKHRGEIPRSKSPRIPDYVRELAEPYEEAERLARIGQAPVMPRATDLGEYFARYSAEYRLTHRPSSNRQLDLTAGKFLGWCKARKVGTVQAVTVETCDAWIANRLAEGAKRSTIRTERGYLSPIWTRARRHRIVAENPWEVARMPGKAEEAPPKFWTVEELVTLAGACEGWVRDWVLLDANVGLRATAVLGLRWKDVNLADGRLTVPPELSKSGRSYSVPLSDVAREVLARRWAEAPRRDREALIFPGPIPDRPMGRKAPYKRIKQAVVASGVRDFGHYCHAIRHSFAVAAVKAGVHLRIVQAWLGHSTIRTTEIYAQLAPDASQDAMKDFRIGPPPPPAQD